VNDSPLHSTLRELHGLMRDGRSWVVLLALSLVIGLIGPFGTYQAMNLAPRLAYWTAIGVGTSAAGTLVAGFCERLLRPVMHRFAAALVAGALAGPFIAAVVAAINLVVFGPAGTVIDLVSLSFYCMAISAAVTLIAAVLERPQPAAAMAEEPPALLERLPRPQRGRLLHISVADHYVEVSTENGRSLVLMRLSDAIREAAPIAGLQVHRSHWVALDAVKRSLRQKGRPALELENGTIVPVSRTYLEAARAAGLLA